LQIKKVEQDMMYAKYKKSMRTAKLTMKEHWDEQ
jgi:hypothetical protein